MFYEAYFYILYRYYYNGSNGIVAYVQSVSILLVSLVFNIFTILIASDKMYLLDFLDINRRARLFLILLFILSAYLVLFLLVKPKKLKHPDLEAKYKRYCGVLFLLYLILTFIFFIILTLVKHKMSN